VASDSCCDADWLMLSRDRAEFSVELKTLSSDGVVFYMSNSQHVDFISLYLKDGRLNYAFNCGSGVALATSTFTYNDNLWHTVQYCSVD